MSGRALVLTVFGKDVWKDYEMQNLVAAWGPKYHLREAVEARLRSESLAARVEHRSPQEGRCLSPQELAAILGGSGNPRDTWDKRVVIFMGEGPGGDTQATFALDGYVGTAADVQGWRFMQPTVLVWLSCHGERVRKAMGSALPQGCEAFLYIKGELHEAIACTWLWEWLWAYFEEPNFFRVRGLPEKRGLCKHNARRSKIHADQAAVRIFGHYFERESDEPGRVVCEVAPRRWWQVPANLRIARRMMAGATLGIAAAVPLLHLGTVLWGGVHGHRAFLVDPHGANERQLEERQTQPIHPSDMLGIATESSLNEGRGLLLGPVQVRAAISCRSPRGFDLAWYDRLHTRWFLDRGRPIAVPIETMEGLRDLPRGQSCRLSWSLTPRIWWWGYPGASTDGSGNVVLQNDPPVTPSPSKE
ncbi:MAG: hypothetical protein ABIO70_27040 [Pseudomonadota bacterium]